LTYDLEYKFRIMKKSGISILIADDDVNIRNTLFELFTSMLSEKNINITETDNGTTAIALLENNDYDVLLLDLDMPGLSGMDVLRQLKGQDIQTEIIILSGHATLSTAVEAIKIGAYDYLTKPFNADELITVVEKAHEKSILLRENILLRTQIKKQSEAKKIITASPLMFELLENVRKIANSDFPVLISGESGVGKELIAKAVHDASERAEGPFITINCGAIPDNMLESELFGYEKGAFTSAYGRKLGLLEIANDGTLFLDEIVELPLHLQAILLRVFETGKFFRIGGTKEIVVNVRFISATNKDLKTEIEKGNFREDLFYRINALPIYIPPLRERKEDIPLLIENFIKNNPAFKDKRFSKNVLDALAGYSWPGNVRELQNIIHRTLLLSQNDIIELSDLPIDLYMGREKDIKRLEDIEKEHIIKVLKEVGGQRGKAAEILGISTKTLYRKLLNFGIKKTVPIENTLQD
jgi:DNA-binding NtrC family response regulator